MANFNRLYKDYKIKYEKAMIKAELKGESMFESDPYSSVEFKAMYEAMQNDMRKEGRTVTPDKTIKALIEKQTYSRSLKQGQALQKAMRERGFDVTVHEARVWGGLEDGANAPQGFQDFWNTIKLRKVELLNQGCSSNEIAKFIAAEFFGS